ncbi:MAG: hypothetical protein CSA95_06220 [Bacteroidetes bacterium]|nr:MAG: hypothetical protein CSA95_06220 [Bacteroidota bacterium]PIE87882.1 MAG: hypothetical protein CSA04_04750 [Bacteroidota bacterium]
MNENFLAFVWKHRLYDLPLFTIDGKPIEVLSPGIENLDAGPDFFNARVRIEKMIWVGNVEIHTKASDWYLHNHQRDPSFNNTVLHVVYDSNRDVMTKVGYVVPQLELKGFLAESPMVCYRRMMETLHWIPCEYGIRDVDRFLIEKMLESCLLERLANRGEAIEELLTRWKGDWMQVFFILLSRAFGTRVNAMAFELMAQATPVTLMLKNAHNLTTLEALLFGQAGMLSSQYRESYPSTLYREYAYMKHKYGLTTIPYSCWKFMRIRPSGFPTIRIAQLAAFFHKNYHQIARFFNAPSLPLLQEAFSLKASPYWNNHVKFGEKVKGRSARSLGKSTVNTLLINAVIPLSFVYLKHTHPAKADIIPDLLYQLPPEDNGIIRKWNQLVPKASSAAHTQAVIQLKKSYCEVKKCLRCLIGHAVLTAN